jgi:hypothetical protein
VSAFISLEGARFAPGSVLRGRVQLEPLADDVSRRVELAVLWETEGKGDTDLGVVLYRVLADGDEQAATGEHTFEVTLPFLPLSYDGTLIKIGWRVRVRRLSAMAQDDVYDEPFELAWP